MRQLIETIIRDRIGELERLERGETSRRMQLSYQDKRDELEALLLRFHALRGTGSTGQGNPS